LSNLLLPKLKFKNLQKFVRREKIGEKFSNLYCMILFCWRKKISSKILAREKGPVIKLHSLQFISVAKNWLFSRPVAVFDQTWPLFSAYREIFLKGKKFSKTSRKIFSLVFNAIFHKFHFYHFDSYLSN